MTLAEVELCSSIANVKGAISLLSNVSVPMYQISSMVEHLLLIEHEWTLQLAQQVKFEVVNAQQES